MYCASKNHKNISLYRQKRYLFDNNAQDFIARFVSKIIESLGEGVLFVGSFLIIRSLSLIHNNYLIVCIIGAFLHLLFEFIGMHRMFCKNGQNLL